MPSKENDRDERYGMQSPGVRNRLGRTFPYQGLVLLGAVLVVGLLLLLLPSGDDESEETVPDREHIAKQRFTLDAPNDQREGIGSLIVDQVVGSAEPQKATLSPEEMARRVYRAGQIGGPIRVKLNKVGSMPGGGQSSQYGRGPQGTGVSVPSGIDAPSNPGYGSPTVSEITATVRPHTLWYNQNRILEGKVMTAITETAIDTTLPGLVRAIFTEDVYSESGDRVLIRKYSEALGKVGTVRIQSGQDRVAVVYHRLLLRTEENDGIVEVRLDSQASDSLGRPGMKGKVDTHWLERSGNALLYTLIGTTASNVSEARSNSQNAQQAYLEGTTEAFRNTAQESLRELDVHEPTITVPRATPITIVAAKDILFREGQVEGVR